MALSTAVEVAGPAVCSSQGVHLVMLVVTVHHFGAGVAPACGHSTRGGGGGGGGGGGLLQLLLPLYDQYYSVLLLPISLLRLLSRRKALLLTIVTGRNNSEGAPRGVAAVNYACPWHGEHKTMLLIIGTAVLAPGMAGTRHCC